MHGYAVDFSNGRLGRSGRGWDRKRGPGDVFLITIRHRLQKPVQPCLWPPDPALPKLDYPPSLIEEQSTITGIPCDVLCEFLLPEAFTSARRRGVAAARMPVPEAAVNENAKPVTGKHQIRPPRKPLLVEAISEAMPMQQSPYLHFRSCVAAANARHHARPDFFADDVHESRPDDLSPSRGYDAGASKSAR